MNPRDLQGAAGRVEQTYPMSHNVLKPPLVLGGGSGIVGVMQLEQDQQQEEQQQKEQEFRVAQDSSNPSERRFQTFRTADSCSQTNFSLPDDRVTCTCARPPRARAPRPPRPAASPSPRPPHPAASRCHPRRQGMTSETRQPKEQAANQDTSQAQTKTPTTTRVQEECLFTTS